ncbi:MAG: nitrogen regulation protein NR(II) [Bacteroidota bacterium]
MPESRSESSEFSISRYFFLKYVLAIIVLVSMSGFLFSWLVKTYLIGAAERYSVSIAKNLNDQLYEHFFHPFRKTPETYNPHDSTHFAILDGIARRFLAHLDVTKINIFNRNAVLMYSTNPEIIGESTPDNRKLLRALQGELVSSLELAHEPPDIVYDTHPVDFLETYIPLREMSPDLLYEGEIVGSFEIYQDVSKIYSQISSLRDLIIVFFVLIVMGHIGIAFFIARRGDRLLAKERKLKEELELSIRGKLEDMVKERTRELEEEKSKLQVILNNVPSALILLDRNLRIQSVSAAYAPITGNAVREARGKVCNLCADFGVPREQCPSRKSLSSGRIESHVVKRENGNACFEHTSVPIKQDGDVEAILEIITDITERRRLQDQLVRAEKATAVGEMAAVIAHEVRNSLTSVKLILQYFSESQKLRRRKEKESIKVAMNSMYRLESIVNDLLNFAKPREMHLIVQDVNQVVREGIIFSRHQFQRKRISLLEDLSPHLPKLTIDAVSLKEVVVNLLLNAAHAVAEGTGVVTIKTAASEFSDTLRESLADYRFFRQGADFATRNDPIGANNNLVELKKGEKIVTIEVGDNGCGIAPENIGRILDPFFTTKTEGTGLGLTMVKRVVNEHGGVFLVESQEGRGSTLKIVFPVKLKRQ